MDIRIDKDLAVEFDSVCKELKKAGKDLSRIPIVMMRGAKPSYITQRIMKEMKND